jgi:hypothetical protein
MRRVGGVKPPLHLLHHTGAPRIMVFVPTIHPSEAPNPLTIHVRHPVSRASASLDEGALPIMAHNGDTQDMQLGLSA